jgi:hypothetical protein
MKHILQRFSLGIFIAFACAVLPANTAWSANDEPDGASLHSATSGRIGKDDLIIEMPASVHKGSEAEVKIVFRNLSHPRLREGNIMV